MGNKNKLPHIFTKEEVEKIFESVYEPKMAMAFLLGLMCGLRIREVCRLQTDDVDLQRRIIKIRDSKDPNRARHGGYGKDRIVPIPEAITSPMKKWKDIIGGSKWFFPSDKSPDMHISTKAIHNAFAEARTRAGLDRVNMFIKYKERTNNKDGVSQYEIKFHSLRHFYATYLYEKTRDLYAVSNLLGHNQVTTTQIYAKVSDKQMKETVDFAFNNPIRTKMFEKNPVNALNYTIPEIAKREKTPIEILEDRYARGEISDADFQVKVRMLKLRKEYLAEEKESEEAKVKIIKGD